MNSGNATYWERVGYFQFCLTPVFLRHKPIIFVNSLELFKIGFSWGGFASPCVPYRIEKMRASWKDQGILVRFNIGLEDPEDLIADIEQVLAKWSK